MVQASLCAAGTDRSRDREDMKRCWGFLDTTSRSFAAVIKELEGDLGRVVRAELRIK